MLSQLLESPQSLISILIALVAIISNKIWRFDLDSGNYVPQLKQSALYNKAFVHFVVGALCCALQLLIGIPIWIVLVIMTPSIVAWEWSQGFINKYDILAGLAGVVAVIYLVIVNAFIYGY